MVKAAAVVPAAGSGSRMGAQVPKQYLPLAGIPLLGHALRVLDTSPVIQSIVLVVAAGEEEFCRKNVVEELGIRKIKAIVTGEENARIPCTAASWRFRRKRNWW